MEFKEGVAKSLFDDKKLDHRVFDWLCVGLGANYSAIILGAPSARAPFVELFKEMMPGPEANVYNIKSEHTLIGILEDETPFRDSDIVHVNLDVDALQRPYFDALFGKKILGIAESSAENLASLVGILDKQVTRGKLTNNFVVQLDSNGIVNKISEIVHVDPNTKELATCTVFTYFNDAWVYSGDSYVLEKTGIKYENLGALGKNLLEKLKQ